MRVLLISFLPGLDPPCGDVTYTQTLLRHPPAGVQYETYADALARGALLEHARRARFRQEPLLTAANKAVNVLRRRGVLFWEPFRFFSVRPGEYDLVHLHVFAARFLNLPCPLVVSGGAPQPDLYSDRRGYSKWRVSATGRVERALRAAFGVNCNSYGMPQAARVLVYTEHFRDYLVRGGYAGVDRVEVIPIMHAAPSPPLRPDANERPRRVGFVARHFEEKGGPVLLAAFERVRRSRPDAELWVIGPDAPVDLSPAEASRRGITWIGPVCRERLLGELLPSLDVFAYPTPHDCFSYVLLEAMAAGLAVATSDYVSMPEAVDYGRAGLTSPVGDPAGLAENILALLEPEANARYRRAARERFEGYFSSEAVAPRLRAAYNRAVATGPRARVA